MTISAGYLAKNPSIISSGGVRGDIPDSEVAVVEGASESYKAGQLVSLAVSTQRVTAVASDVTTASVFGLVLEDATGVTDTACHVVPLYPDQLLKVRCYTTSAEGTTSGLKIGQKYALTVTGNICYLETTDTSNDFWIYEGPILDGAGNDTVWAKARIVYTALQAYVGQ